MSAGSLIKGHVAEVLNAREVVINRGIQHGVELGMKFAILAPRGGREHRGHRDGRRSRPRLSSKGRGQRFSS